MFIYVKIFQIKRLLYEYTQVKTQEREDGNSLKIGPNAAAIIPFA